MNKHELAIARAINETTKSALKQLSGESLITAAWVISEITHHAQIELSKVNDKFDFIKFQQESSIEED